MLLSKSPWCNVDSNEYTTYAVEHTHSNVNKRVNELLFIFIYVIRSLECYISHMNVFFFQYGVTCFFSRYITLHNVCVYIVKEHALWLLYNVFDKSVCSYISKFFFLYCLQKIIFLIYKAILFVYLFKVNVCILSDMLTHLAKYFCI